MEIVEFGAALLSEKLGLNVDKDTVSAALSQLLGDGQIVERAKPMFWHLQKSRPIVVLRDGDYCLVANPDYELSTDNTFKEVWIPSIRTGGYDEFQLFNLREDPSQKHDISSNNPELVERLRKSLLAINASIMSAGPDWSVKSE